MAKDKSFNFDNLITPVKPVTRNAAAPDPAPTIEKKIDPPEPIAPVEVLQNSIKAASNDFLSMQPKKKKNKKLVSFNLNEDDYIEFTRINKSLGYKNTEVIADLIKKYINANQNR